MLCIYLIQCSLAIAQAAHPDPMQMQTIGPSSTSLSLAESASFAWHSTSLEGSHLLQTCLQTCLLFDQLLEHPRQSLD
jgi:hypothetical protein